MKIFTKVFERIFKNFSPKKIMFIETLKLRKN